MVKKKALEPDQVTERAVRRGKRPRTSAQLTWQESPTLIERIVFVWDLYLKHVPYSGIIAHVSREERFRETFNGEAISLSAVKSDVKRARELWKEEFAERADELIAELDAQRRQLTLEVYEELDRLEQLRTALYPCGVDKEGAIKYTSDSPSGVAATKAKLFKVLDDNMTAEERLLGVRREGGGEGGSQDNRVQILVVEGTKVKLLETRGHK